MKRRLGIDDCRELSHCSVLCRNYSDGIKALETMGPWDELFLDHDLASYVDGVEKTGYDVMLFLEQNPNLLPGEIILVTSNPVGRQRMQVVIDRLYKK